MDPTWFELNYSNVSWWISEDEGKHCSGWCETRLCRGWNVVLIFPTTGDAFQNHLTGSRLDFVSRLDQRGAELEYSA